MVFLRAIFHQSICSIMLFHDSLINQPVKAGLFSFVTKQKTVAAITDYQVFKRVFRGSIITFYDVKIVPAQPRVGP